MNWEDILKTKRGGRGGGRMSTGTRRAIQRHGGFYNMVMAKERERITRELGKEPPSEFKTVKEMTDWAKGERERQRIAREEENLPEDVKRARERVRQGLPSIEQPLIPQFDDEKRMKRGE